MSTVPAHSMPAAPPPSAYPIAEYYERFFAKLPAEGVPTGGLALDVGCGNAEELAWLRARHARVVAVDLHLSEAARRSGADLVRADVRRLPFRDGAFRLAYEKDVLHHVGEARKGDGPAARDVDAALAEMRRVLAPGGAALLVEGNRYNPVSFLHMTLRHGHQHFARRAFRRMVRQRFPAARFHAFESHYYPAGRRGLVRAIHLLEAAFERAPLRWWSSYNAAVAPREA